MFRSIFRVGGSPTTVLRRYLVTSNDVPQIPVLTFSQLKEELEKKDSDVVVIDVREPVELINDGRISDKAMNIPLGQVAEAVQLSEDVFRKQYGFDKPEEEAELIVHCKAGVRAMKAAVAMNQAGYSRVRVYNGILDWVENGGKLV